MLQFSTWFFQQQGEHENGFPHSPVWTELVNLYSPPELLPMRVGFCGGRFDLDKVPRFEDMILADGDIYREPVDSVRKLLKGEHDKHLPLVRGFIAGL